MPPFKTRIDNDGRECTACLEWKPWIGFQARSLTRGGYSEKCKECEREKRLSSEGRKRQSKNQLKTRGWTPEMKEVVLSLQDGKCANPACDKPAKNADHDHDTGEARAMMCWRCNTALGHLEEDPELIRGLAEYAEQCQNVKAWVII